jgi:hypothetical protein
VPGRSVISPTMGIIRISGRPFPENERRAPGMVLVPAGIYGPEFVVTPNFYVIKEYNNSDLYALFIGNLADRMAYGVGAFVTPWGTCRRDASLGHCQACRQCWSGRAMMLAAPMACLATRPGARSANGRPRMARSQPASRHRPCSRRCASHPLTKRRLVEAQFIQASITLNLSGEIEVAFACPPPLQICIGMTRRLSVASVHEWRMA